MAQPEPSKQKQQEATIDQEDEFEEFAIDDWDQRAEDPANQELWEADWDDDNAADDFSQRLKEELARQAAAAQK
eukprot:scaffold2.g7026.t1